MGIANKKYFGDLPKATKIYARKYFSAEEADNEHKVISNFPTALELMDYEQLFEGAAERIICLLEKEQTQRHNWEMRALRIQNLGRRFGQVLFAMIFLALTYAFVVLIKDGYQNSAIILLSVGFFSLIAIIFMIRKQRFNIEKRYNVTKRFNDRHR